MPLSMRSSHSAVPDRPAGQRLEGGGADEVRAGRGQHDVDRRTGLDQQARQFRRLVGRDAAGDAEHDALALQFVHDR